MQAHAAEDGWPVVIEARHVRLSAAHVELLFGAGHNVLELVQLLPTGRFASADVVDVRGPTGTLKGVRVLGPIASATRVYLSDDDAVDCGVDITGTRTTSPRAGVTVEGPRGTLVLASDAVDDVRRLVVPRGFVMSTSTSDASSLDVLVHSERARELRGVRVEQSEEATAPWLAIDVGMANALDVGPSTRASTR